VIVDEAKGQLFLDVLVNFAPEKDRSDGLFTIEVVCAYTSVFSIISTF